MQKKKLKQTNASAHDTKSDPIQNPRRQSIEKSGYRKTVSVLLLGCW